MNFNTYNKICAEITTYSNRDCLRALFAEFPDINQKTLTNIVSQNYQIKTKKVHHFHHKQDNAEAYYSRYLKERSTSVHETILKIADDIDLSPALLARIILERYLHSSGQEPVTKSAVTHYMRNTSLIADPVLATDIYACVVADKHYGPMADIVKHSIGHEYECWLKQNLNARGLAYICEETMRDRGYDKTPDVKLEIPIAVDGRVVNWIESKASFGDEVNHKAYEKDQYWCYWNRFGPGMVIYWFGFILELDVNRDKGIILLDHFPEDIVTMMPGSKLAS